MRPVYFHVVPSGPPDRAEYQSLAVSLAEGLRALGPPPADKALPGADDDSRQQVQRWLQGLGT